MVSGSKIFNPTKYLSRWLNTIGACFALASFSAATAAADAAVTVRMMELIALPLVDLPGTRAEAAAAVPVPRACEGSCASRRCFLEGGAWREGAPWWRSAPKKRAPKKGGNFRMNSVATLSSLDNNEQRKWFFYEFGVTRCPVITFLNYRVYATT